MKEIEALGKIDEALGGLADDATRHRVLQWAVDKYGEGISTPVSAKSVNQAGSIATNPVDTTNVNTPQGTLPITPDSKEVPGIAMITDSGEFQLTVRDVKAKNTNDAAIRLAVVAIRIYCQLSGENSASSRHLIKPILENWRAYTGNTRAALGAHQGIIRNGDALSLDQHAKAEADEYIRQILDQDVVGSWKASTAIRKRKKRIGDSSASQD